MTSTVPGDRACEYAVEYAVAQAEPAETVSAYAASTSSRAFELIGAPKIRASRTVTSTQTMASMKRDGREVYISCPGGSDRDSIAAALDAARGELRHAPVRPPRQMPSLFEPAWADDQTEATGYAVTEQLTARRRELVESAAAGLGDGSLAGLRISERSTWQAFRTSGGRDLRSAHRGYEIALIGLINGVTAGITRYVSDLAEVDLVAAGRELRLILSAMSTSGATEHREPVALMLPGATAELLRQLVSAIMVSPLTGVEEWATEIVDDARVAAGYRTRSFDHEGTPTGCFTLVGRDGRQMAMRSRHVMIGPRSGAPEVLTGHADWLVWQNLPQPRPANVRLTEVGGVTAALLEPAAYGQAIVEVRPLGVQHLSSGEMLAFRAACVAVDERGTVTPLAPIVLAGTARDFLRSFRMVAPVVSYLPGEISPAGCHAVLNLSRISQ